MEELVDEIMDDIEFSLNARDIELDDSEMDEIRDLLDMILENH